MEQTKKCSKCGEVKALEEFHKRTEAMDGRRGVCKVCDHQRLLEGSRKYAASHQEERRASFKAWYWRNREAQLERTKRYAEQNADAMKAKRIAEYAASPELYRARSSVWAKANREKKNAYERDYVTRSPKVRAERDAAAMRAYHKGREGLSDSYVKQTLVAMGLASTRADVPPELIALKREQLAIKRMARELKKAATKPTGEPG